MNAIERDSSNDRPGKARMRRDRPAPVMKSGEALVRVHQVGLMPIDGAACVATVNAAGTSGSSGGEAAFSGAVGHAFAGIVERVDSARPEHASWVGKRVTGWPVVVCGRCELCRGGLSQHCLSRKVMGLRGRDGFASEWATLPIANLASLPKAVHDDHAVFGPALAMAMHAARRVTVPANAYVSVVGDTISGLLLAQVLARLYPSVRVLGRSEERIRSCERWGIKHRLISEAGRRQDQHLVFDATGCGAEIETALSMVLPRGKIVVCADMVQPGSTAMAGTAGNAAIAPMARAADAEVEIVGARGGRISDAVDCLLRGEVEVLSLISKRFKLADVAQALRTVRDAGAGVVILEA